MLIELTAAEYKLVLAPEAGGSIARFEWRGQPLMRTACGPSIVETACFPLVPFSNRIAFGRFDAGGRRVRLSPNFPDHDHPHPLHGFGWLADWTLVRSGPGHAVLRHDYGSGEWPWAYAAEQEFQLSDFGLCHALRLRNQGDTPMPAGLGVHPYFPRTSRTVYHGLHRGEWLTAADGLPVALRRRSKAIDWWHGQPIACRSVDTVYTDRQGPLRVDWPERRLGLRIDPDERLAFTVVHVPRDADFFCVEPVTHMTDAINRPSETDGLRWLLPGGAMSVQVCYRAFVTAGSFDDDMLSHR